MATSTTTRRDIRALVSDPERIEHRAAILRALGNPVRLQIVATLCEGEHTVGDISDWLEQPQSSISRQLSWLRLHKVVQERVDGRYRWYRLAIPEVVDLVGCLARCTRKDR